MPELLDLSPDELKNLLVSWGQPAYRAGQVLNRVYRRFVTSYDQMTDLPVSLRSRLAEEIGFTVPSVAAEQVSADGSTTKALLRLGDGNTVETVLMRYTGSEAGRARNTVCIS